LAVTEELKRKPVATNASGSAYGFVRCPGRKDRISLRPSRMLKNPSRIDGGKETGHLARTS
jgi:hypothetical protein